MNGHFDRTRAFFATALVCFISCRAPAGTNETDAARWLAGASPVPAFTVPASRARWETRRKQIRAELVPLLGKLPARPKVPKIETLSREDRGDYILEKFQFDN